MIRERTAAIPWFCAILLAIVGWQVFYCAAATGGKPSGLFFIGEGMHWPGGDPGTYVYPNSNGYDGQIYRVIAHDPGMRGAGNALYGPRYWYRRIAIPAAAALLGRGNPAAIDLWYIAITDLVMAFGGLCFVRLAAGLCHPGLAAAIYCAIPAVVASTDRMVVDGPMLALTVAAWWFYRERRFPSLLATLAAAALTRETAICIAGGAALAHLLDRRYRRAALCGAALVPAMGWWGWLALHTGPTPMDAQLSAPLWPQIARLFWRFWRAGSPAFNLAMQALDWLAMATLVAAFAWVAAVAAKEFRAGRLKDDTALVLPMAGAATFFSNPVLITEPYHFMRHASVLTAWVALRLLRMRPLWAALYVGAAGASLLAYRMGPVLRLAGR